MKIDDLNQKSGVAYLVAVGRTDKTEGVEAASEAAAKPQAGTDKVELSSYMPKVTAAERKESFRVDRIEELKSQIAAGTYQVPAMAIAEKMAATFAAGRMAG